MHCFRYFFNTTDESAIVCIPAVHLEVALMGYFLDKRLLGEGEQENTGWVAMLRVIAAVGVWNMER